MSQIVFTLEIGIILSQGLSISYHNCSFLAVVLMESQHVSEREITANVAVQNKERLFVFKKNVACQRQWTSCNRCKSLSSSSGIHIIISSLNNAGHLSDHKELVCCGSDLSVSIDVKTSASIE